MKWLEGNRKLVMAAIAMIGITVAVCLGSITSDEFKSVMEWIVGFAVGGNVAERIIDRTKKT